MKPLSLRHLTSIVAFFAAVAILLPQGVSAAGKDRPPNVVIIFTDDQGWGTTSALYDPQHPLSKSDFFQTPNLERLIAQGMRFTQAYSAHPNSSPSRAALLTGRSPAARLGPATRSSATSTTCRSPGTRRPAASCALRTF